MGFSRALRTCCPPECCFCRLKSLPGVFTDGEPRTAHERAHPETSAWEPSLREPGALQGPFPPRSVCVLGSVSETLHC